jgi:hypothetical protein
MLCKGESIVNHKFSLKTLSLVVVCLLLLTACGGTGGGGGGGGGDPAAAAKSFFEAVFTGKGDAAALVCKSGGDAFKQGMDSMKTTLTASGATIDIAGLKFEAANQSGDSADVKVSGKMKITVSGASTEQDFPPSTIKMKNEGGWKVCG